MYDTWKSPETLAIISKIAGVDLVTEMDFEIGHVNISVKSEKQKAEELIAFAEKTSTEADEGIAGCPWEDDKPIVDWHTDSYPFVCVTMLSDCTTMIGGETALRTGNGNVLKVRGPQMVSEPDSYWYKHRLMHCRGVLSFCKDVISSIKLFGHLAQQSVLRW